MAQDINIVLFLKKENGETLHDIKIEKFTFSAAAMSLEDKLSGSFLYPDLSLIDEFTRQEYVEYQGAKFWLQKTPNIEQKGLLSENGDMQGMVRYVCEFTPEKSSLYNIPFTDIARPNTNESKFRVGGREFFLFSRIDEFVSRIDANLMYHTNENSSDPNRWKCVLMDGLDPVQIPLPDAPMSFQGTFISDALKTLYDTYKVPWNILGKTIYVGVPVNEVGHIFKFGQGVGLLNNDRVRKDNKVITRLAYAGSERNIPFRYPIIKKYADKDKPYHEQETIEHPYHQTRLMPTSYVEAVQRKIDNTHPEYNPNIALIDYIDAIGEEYPTPINPNLPVYHYETDAFNKIFPTIKDLIYKGNAIDTFKSIVTVNWDDHIDQGTGEVRQPHFVVELHPMGFDLWACAAVQDIMTFWMNTGSCQGAKFQVGYNAEEYEASFFVKDENGVPVFDPTFRRRNWERFPDSTNESIKLRLLKDIESFGTLMPNQWQIPSATDKFVIINIELPQIYITNAQTKLDEEAEQYLKDNNFDKFDYPLVFDAFYLAENQTILNQINTNTLVPFEYRKQIMKLPVQSMTVQYGDNAIPKYDIKLTDEITITMNSVNTISKELSDTNNAIAQNEVRGARQAANFFQGLRTAHEGVFDVDGVPKLKLVEALLVRANSLLIGTENRNFAPIDAAMTIMGLDSLSITQSQIIHYNVSRTAEYDVDEARWFMQPFFINTLNPDKDYYVYVQANRTNNSAQWVVLEKIEENQNGYDDDPNVFWFYWGQLNVINNRREPYPEWGLSVFSGGTQWQMRTQSPNFVLTEDQFVGMMIDWLDAKIWMGDGAQIIAKNIAIRQPDNTEVRVTITFTNPKDEPPFNPQIGDTWSPMDEYTTYTYFETGWRVTGDSTMTVINGGIVTANTIQAGSPDQYGYPTANTKAGMSGLGNSDDSIRFWAGKEFKDRGLAPFKVYQDGSFIASKATIEGTIYAESGQIGGFFINGNGLTNNFNYDSAYIIFRYDPGGIFAGIGTNVFPGTAGIRTAARFENMGTDIYGTNIGMYVAASNALKNSAIHIGAGYISGFAINQQQINSSQTLNHSQCYLSCYNTAPITITLPAPTSAEIGKVYYIRRMNAANIALSGKIHTSGQVSSVNIGTGIGDTAMVVNDGQFWCYNILL